MTDQFDVAIVGYGPVGATLANLLVQQGLRVAVLEREGDVYHLARAGHLDAEVMRVLQSIDIADAFEPDTGQTKAMRFVNGDGKLLMEWKRGGERGPNGWVSDYMFYQPTLEGHMRKRLAGAPGFKQFLMHDVYEIESGADGVTVRAEDVVSNKLVSLRARYVVGCDGARSLVRRLIGATHEDLGFKQRWLVVNVNTHTDMGFEPVSTQICDPARPAYAGASGQRLRWEFMVHDGESSREMLRHENIWNLIENSVRPIKRDQGEIIRSAVYTFESLIAKRWRAGRLLIAGDAAHRMPPFLGQGMCAGVRDASNLAWKLAAVLRGRASPALLDSYNAERLEAAQQNVQVTNRTARFLRPADGMERCFRTAAISLARQYPFARALVNTGRMAVANTYTRSPICESTGGQSVQNVAFRWANGSQGVVNDLLQWADGDLLVLVFGELPAAGLQRLRQLAQHAPVRSVQVLGPDERAQAREQVRDTNARGTGHLQGACHVFGHAWALLRPDGYLAATGEAVDGHLVAAVEKALGLR